MKRAAGRVLALELAALALAALALHAPDFTVTDVDGYYHLRHAWVYGTLGPWLHEFPWVECSAIHDQGADLWYGFHVLLIPLTWLSDLVLALRAGAVAVTLASLLAVHAAVRRLDAAWPIVWTLLFALGSADLSFRLTMLRPHPLSLGLCLWLFALLARALAGAPRRLGAAGLDPSGPGLDPRARARGGERGAARARATLARSRAGAGRGRRHRARGPRAPEPRRCAASGLDRGRGDPAREEPGRAPGRARARAARPRYLRRAALAPADPAAGGRGADLGLRARGAARGPLERLRPGPGVPRARVRERAPRDGALRRLRRAVARRCGDGGAAAGAAGAPR